MGSSDDRKQSTEPIASRRDSGRSRSRSRTPERTERKEAAGVTVKDGTISIKTGTIITVIAALLGTGGSTTLVPLLNRPSPEVVERLDAIEARLEAQEAAQLKSARLSGIIYKTIIRANPDAAIPLEDLGLDDPP